MGGIITSTWESMSNGVTGYSKTLDNICEKICVSRLTCNLRKVGTSKLLALLCNGDRNLAIVANMYTTAYLKPIIFYS